MFTKCELLSRCLVVFGAVDYTSGRVMMEPVARRDADTLLPVIQSTVAAGSIIWSDMWRAYHDLRRLGYAHQTVNHSQQFVAANGVNTQMIEGCWSLCKQYLRRRGLKSRQMMAQYIHEWCFRRNLASNFASAWHHLTS